MFMSLTHLRLASARWECCTCVQVSLVRAGFERVMFCMRWRMSLVFCVCVCLQQQQLQQAASAANQQQQQQQQQRARVCVCVCV